MNNKPSLESQFLVALLAFTSLLYGNVWFMAQTGRPAETAGYAVNSQLAKGTPPDFSGWSREEVEEYLVREVKKQISNPSSYFAVAAATVDYAVGIASPPASAPITPPPAPTPAPQTQQIQQCNQPFIVRDLSSLSSGLSGVPTSAFAGPRPSAGPQSAAEYYLAFIGTLAFPSLPNLYAIHLGQNGMTYSGVETLFRGQENLMPTEVTASNRFISYVLSTSRPGPNPAERRVVVLRYIGSDGMPGGGDDTFVPLFDEALLPGIRLAFNGISYGSANISIAGNKIGIFVQYGSNLQQRHLLLYTLAPNGTVVNIEVPTAATIMRPIPPNHVVTSIRVAATGAVTLYFASVTGTPPQFFDFMSPGLDGLWNNSGDEQRIAFGETQPTTVGSPGPEISEDGQFVSWDQGTPSPTQATTWRLFDAGADRVPNTPDDGGLFNITPPSILPNTSFSVRAVRGTTSAIPSLPRSSAVAVLSESFSPSAASYFHFFESGPDQIPGGQDVQISLPSGPARFLSYKVTTLASEGDITLFTHERIPLAEPILRAIRWCYQ